MRIRSLSFLAVLFGIVFLLAPPLQAEAPDAPPTLIVRETGVALYARQDPETAPIATLRKDEKLFPLVEAVGREPWYLVRTQQGMIGWVRAADVIVSSETRGAFREAEGRTPTWSARTADGRIYTGTWSVAPDSTRRSASGGWTLAGPDGSTVMRGTWSADKHATGWNGVWHARIEGRDSELSGSWSADLPHIGNPHFSELFAAAARNAIHGLWTGGRYSGSWAMRGAQK